MVEPTPALVPVRTQETWVKLARGYNLRNVRLTVTVNGEKAEERFGEMEFTNFGVSGPIVMELSSRIPDWMARGTVRFSIDLKPALDLRQLSDRVVRDFEKHHDRLFAGALRDLVPGPLIPLILELSDVPSDKPATYVSPEEQSDLAALLKNIVLTVNGLWGFNHAIVTQLCWLVY